MKYVIGNWKMHLGVRESVALARGVLRSLRGKEISPEIILCPPFTSLSEVHKVLARSSVKLGAQNCGPEKNGAFTGEVSVSMLKDVYANYVLIGHSERRHVFAETNEAIAQKMKLTMDSKVNPILCVGELKEIREAGKANEYVSEQILSALQGLKIPSRQTLIIAYEPVWAIGSGETPAVGDVVEMQTFIRELAMKETGLKADRVKVLYGGSVNEENAYSFLRESSVDGLLVGGASLKLASFIAIIDSARDVMSAQA
jgi:triosephosphate isomerase